MGKQSNENTVVGCAIVFVVLFVINAVGGISDNDPRNDSDLVTIEDARARGINAGSEDGFQAGKADRLDQARHEGYEGAVNEAKASRDFFLMPLYCALISGGMFASGYFGQFAIFYALRRIGILADIDRILLPRSSRVVQLRINEKG